MVTPQQHAVLESLVGSAAMTGDDVAKKLNRHGLRAEYGRVLRRLEVAGYVERRSRAGEQSAYTITPAGKRVLGV